MEAILAPVGLAHLDPGDLGHGIPLVRRFERAAEEILLLQRLRGEAWIDAARAQEQELLRSVPVGGVDDVRLDLQVLTKEICRVRIVRQNASHFGRSEKYIAWAVRGEERVDVRLIRQIELAMPGKEQAAEAALNELPRNGAADEAGMACDQNRVVTIHGAHSVDAT